MDGSAEEAGRRAWPGIAGGALAVLLVAGCGLVPHPEEQARDLATDRVRDEAAGFGTSLWAGLRAADAAGAREVIRQHAELLDPSPGEDGPHERGLLAASVGSDGAVVLDLVFRDQADAGGGLSYAQAVAQLCVRVTGTPGRGGQVRLADLACPASPGHARPGRPPGDPGR